MQKKILIALLKFPVYLAMNEEHGGSKVNARGRERCHMSWHSPFASLAQCEAAPDTLRSYRVLPELRKQILPILFLTFTLIYAALLKFLVHEQNLSSMKAHLHPQRENGYQNIFASSFPNSIFLIAQYGSRY